MRKLFKTTIIIWYDEDPTERYELVDLAQEATGGDMYCSVMHSEPVEDPEKDPAWDGCEFFNEDDSE